jgi:hypothetical protein
VHVVLNIAASAHLDADPICDHFFGSPDSASSAGPSVSRAGRIADIIDRIVNLST